MTFFSLLHTLWFVLVLFGLFLVPGWFVLRAILPRAQYTLFEWTLIALLTSITLLDILMLSLNALHITLSVWSILIPLIVILIACWYRIRHTYSHQVFFQQPFQSMHFTPASARALLILLLLTLLIKSVFLFGNSIPSSTDLGHHMYWAKSIAETGHIPLYAKNDIIEIGGQYQVSQPLPIADFIVGEHLPFAALALFSGMSFFSAFPLITLLFINLASVLALAVLAWRLISTDRHYPQTRLIAMLITLFCIGPVYALSSPQAKFVSGGVVGNTLGNLFIPILILLYFRALREKNTRVLTLAFFLTFGLAYTHHLSTLMFLAASGAMLVFFTLAHIRTCSRYFRQWFHLIMRPAPLLFIACAILFFFFVYTPSYADPRAIGTALGAPTKTTRAGMTLLDLTNGTVGIARMGLGLGGIILLFFTLRRRYAAAFILGWTLILLIMSLRPQWIMINIPSNRVSTYAIFPLVLLTGWLCAWIITRLRTPSSPDTTPSPTLAFLPHWLMLSLALLWTGALLSMGYTDNSAELGIKEKNQGVVETFAVSRYVASHTTAHDIVLKDHNYLLADAWMKSFFMRGYAYPLSRGYFKRYEDATKDREQCTLWMISVPNTPKGQKCYTETGTDYVIVNPHIDRKQFERSRDFSLVYLSDNTAVYIHRPL